MPCSACAHFLRQFRGKRSTRSISIGAVYLRNQLFLRKACMPTAFDVKVKAHQREHMHEVATRVKAAHSERKQGTPVGAVEITLGAATP